MTDQERSTVDGAIDEVEQRAMEEELARLSPRSLSRVPILHEVHRWNGRQEITIGAVPGELPTMLLWDSTEGAWRAIFLEDGTTWRIVPDRPVLWTPPAPGGPAT